MEADIKTAIEIIQVVLDRANHLIDKEHLAAAVIDLNNRVDDWKSLKVEAFGELLRFGSFTVLKGDGGKDTEREVCIRNFRGRQAHYVFLRQPIPDLR